MFFGRKAKGKGESEAVEYSDADIVMFIDGDDTYSAEDISLVLEPLISGDADMVVGSRMRGRREAGSISHLNTVGNRLFNSAINFAMKSNLTDSLSGLRAMHRTAFLELVLFSDSFEIEIEMMVEALGQRYRVIEVPVSYNKRKKGSNTKLHPIKDGIQIGRTLLFILMNVNPLKFFGILALGFFTIGLYPALLVLSEKLLTGSVISIPSVVFASLLFVSGAMCLVVGVLSELIVTSRRRIESMMRRNGISGA